MKFRQALFWDVNPKNIDEKKNAQYIIERILDFGNDKEVRWMWKTYSKRTLKRIVEKSRCLMPETKKLWTMLLQSK